MYTLYKLREKCFDHMGNFLVIGTGILLVTTVTLSILGKL